MFKTMGITKNCMEAEMALEMEEMMSEWHIAGDYQDIRNLNMVLDPTYKLIPILSTYVIIEGLPHQTKRTGFRSCGKRNSGRSGVSG